MISHHTFPLAVATALAAHCSGQATTPIGQLLDAVIARVEQSYIGYAMEVAPDERRSADYATHCAALRERARTTSPRDTLVLLRDYVRWFDDGHLFVQHYPRYTAAELAEFANGPRIDDAAAIADRLRQNAANLDPIEGLWFTPEHEVAVERTAPGASTFVATVLQTTASGWQAGDLIAEFERQENGHYRANLRMADHSPRQFEGRLKRVLLHMPPHTWGRRWPVPEHERDTLNESDPRAPRLRLLDDDAALISLPSLSPKYGKRLGRLCHDERDEITARRLLIIDLRGNSGGSSTAARPLAPFYHSERRGPPAYDGGAPHVLASPDSLSYYKRMKGGFFTPKWLRSLRRRLAEKTGEVIPFYEEQRRHTQFVPKTTHARPEHVAILTDGNVVSAGEAFVLEARRHAKVRVFGQPTGGMIDYQNVMMVVVESGRERALLGLPVIAASRELPTGGYNRTGVPPDVLVDRTVTDLVGHVRKQYR